MSEDLNAVYTPGMEVANQTNEPGTLGCFARNRADGSAVLLSNAHVLFNSVTDQQNVPIYSPPSSSSCCRNRRIAITLHDWASGFGPERGTIAAHDPTVWHGFETDCAVAKLQPHVVFNNQVPQIGIIAGTPAAGNNGVVQGPAFGTPPTPGQLVRFYSPVTRRVHYGTILKPVSTGTYEGGAAMDPLVWPNPATSEDDNIGDARPNVGQFMVMPRPAPGESLEPYLNGRRQLIFGQSGDSGSVIVNNDNQVIGLLCRAGPGHRPNLSVPFDEWRAVFGVGFLNPIQKVLDLMGIDIPPNFAQTTPSAGPVYFVMPGIDTDPREIELERGQQRVAGQMRRSRLGRSLLGQLDRHRKEARQIVLENRHARVIWHRHQGPAFVKHCIDNLRDPAHVVPTSINGVDRVTLLGAMADVFLRYGSPRLRRDVNKYRALALQYGPSFTSFDQVVPLIDELGQQWLSCPRRQA